MKYSIFFVLMFSIFLGYTQQYENNFRGNHLATYQFGMFNIISTNHFDNEVVEDCIFRLRAIYPKTKLIKIPFGLFASTAVMKWGEDTNITIPDLGDFQRHTRLDMHFWGALIKQITQMPVVRQNSNYYPNNSLYTLGDKLRYVEYTYKNNARRYTISAVDNSEYLQAILANATNGLTFNQLVLELQSIVDVNAKEAKDFIDEIINAQLLVSELEPTVTGAEYVVI